MNFKWCFYKGFVPRTRGGVIIVALGGGLKQDNLIIIGNLIGILLVSVWCDDDYNDIYIITTNNYAIISPPTAVHY